MPTDDNSTTPTGAEKMFGDFAPGLVHSPTTRSSETPGSARSCRRAIAV
jgi:hypothetical protein